MFKIKDARDFLIDKDWYYGFKTGYQSMNSERMHSHIMAGKFRWFDFLVIKADRKGHEIKNYDYDKYDSKQRRKTREKADPYNIEKDSTLVKFAFSPNDTNRFSVGYDNSKTSSQGTDWSYNLSPLTHTNLTAGNWGNASREHEYRHTDDRSTRKNLFFVYENYDETPLWDTLKISYNKQNIKLKARTDEYCDAGDKCDELSNASGIHIQDDKLVDKYGKDLKVATKEVVYDYVPDSAWRPGKKYTKEELDAMEFENEDYKQDILNDQEEYGVILSSKKSSILTYSKDDELKEVKQYKSSGVYVNCDEYDCSKPLTLMTQDRDKKSNKYVQFDLSQRVGKFAKLASSEDLGYLVLPSKRGFLDNNWKDRDLNTNTKQLNFDLTKDFSIKETYHSLSYGGIYGTTEKA